MQVRKLAAYVKRRNEAAKPRLPLSVGTVVRIEPVGMADRSVLSELRQTHRASDQSTAGLSPPERERYKFERQQRVWSTGNGLVYSLWVDIAVHAVQHFPFVPLPSGYCHMGST